MGLPSRTDQQERYFRVTQVYQRVENGAGGRDRSSDLNQSKEGTANLLNSGQIKLMARIAGAPISKISSPSLQSMMPPARLNASKARSNQAGVGFSPFAAD